MWHVAALTADIEKAFLMIGITPDDRDMLRFLWMQNPHDVESDIMELRFTHFVFGFRPSPAILGSVISHHLDKYHLRHPEIIPLIKNSFYADDLISGGSSVEEPFSIYKVTKQAMSEGGFNLRKWNLNLFEFLSKLLLVQVMIQMGEREYFLILLLGATAKQVSNVNYLVAIIWNSSTDEFTFCFAELIDLISKLPSNRRSLLKVTASTYI